MGVMSSCTATTDMIERCTVSGVTVATNQEGRSLTTIACGGPLKLLIRPDTADQVVETYRIAHGYTQELPVLGFGSNLLIADEGIAVPVIQLGKGFRYSAIERTAQGVIVTAGGAMSLTALSREVAQAGLSGLEFAGGIPASIGGAVAMNAGAHGSDISAVLIRAKIFSPQTGLVELQQHDFSFSYRRATLPPGAIVLEATFRLVEADTDTVQKLLQENLAERKKHQPLMYPSCGSVFKNPDAARGGAGALIESVGLKGSRSGAVEISSMHANWIVNQTKKGRAQDVFTLIQRAQNTVLTQCNVKLVPEVKLWGFLDVQSVVSNY